MSLFGLWCGTFVHWRWYGHKGTRVEDSVMTQFCPAAIRSRILDDSRRPCTKAKSLMVMRPLEIIAPEYINPGSSAAAFGVSRFWHSDGRHENYTLSIAMMWPDCSCCCLLQECALMISTFPPQTCRWFGQWRSDAFSTCNLTSEASTFHPCSPETSPGLLGVSWQGKEVIISYD